MELFALLKGAKYFTALNLCIGYYHIKLNKESIPKSAFTTVFGKSEDSGYLAYLDDILIYSKTKQEHQEMLNNAFEHLCKTGLKIKLSKCSFFKEQIHYLDHLVRGASILPLTNKIEALMKLKLPTNIKEFRHFLSLTGYYCKFKS